jgi:uncharacterized protein (TIGR03492 family)
VRVWFVSNGRGEDRSAALIARELCTLVPAAEVVGAPIVGAGDEYQARGIPAAVRGARPASGGFSTVGPSAFVRDAPALPSYAAWYLSARRLARRGDRSVVVGDVFALLLARAAIGTPDAFVSLPKSSVHLPHSRLERPILRRVPRHVFARDLVTAQALARAGIAASWLGNPLMDDLEPTVPPPEGPVHVTLLPGSRGEALRNLEVLLAVVERLDPLLRFVCALVPSLDRADVARAAERCGWAMSGDRIRNGERAVDLWWNRFADAIHASALVVGMAGTANEQAAGLGRAVVTCRGRGPQACRARLRAQERLLGGAAVFVDGSPEAVAAEAARLLDSPDERARRGQAGQARMGPPGASARIAQHLADRWSNLA